MYWQLVERPLAASEESDGEAHDDERRESPTPSVTLPMRRRQRPTPAESPDSKRKPAQDEP